MQEFGRAVRSAWGSGAALKLCCRRSVRQLAMFERMSASPDGGRHSRVVPDRRPADPANDHRAHWSSMPATTSFRCRAAVPRRHPRPRMLEFDGTDHALARRSRRENDRDRRLPHRQPRGTLAVTSCPAHLDVHRHGRIDGTAAATMTSGGGRYSTADEVWPTHRTIGGTVVKSTGDGHLTTFDGPRRPSAAPRRRADAETLGIEIRAGIHTGDANYSTPTSGIAIHIAARIWPGRRRRHPRPHRPGPGRRLGHRLRTAAASSCVACPAPGNLAVDRHGARAGSAEAALVSMPALALAPRCAARPRPGGNDRTVDPPRMARLAPATSRS